MADLPDFSQFDWIGLDTETRDPHIQERSGWAYRDGEVIGHCIATPERSYYLPVRHPEDNVDEPDKLREKLAHEFKRFKGTVIGLNLLYDLGWETTDGIEFGPEATYYDAGWAETLIDETQFSYSLNAIAKRHGHAPKDERLLKEAAACYGIDPKAEMFKLPARYVGEYGEADCMLPVLIRQTQAAELERQKLWRPLATEHSLLPVLVAMRKRGIRVDVDAAEQLQHTFYAKRLKIIGEIHRLTGSTVDEFEPASLVRLFNERGLDYPRTRLGKPSFTADWLKSQTDPVCKLVLQARKYTKAARDFAGSMVLGHQVNGRVHPEFHPLRSDEDEDRGGGAITGRFTCNGPNLQQVPARDPELGPAIRSLFLPEEGEEWYAIDYSSHEPRLGVHFAGLKNFPGAAAAVKKFCDDPNTDYHQMVADMAGIERKPAKTINLGLDYGMGGLKLCRSLGLPTKWIEITDRESGLEVSIEVMGDEAKALLGRYHAGFPFKKALFDDVQKLALERGWIRTIGGRVLHFNLWEPATFRRGFHPALPFDEAKKRYGAVKRAFGHKALNKLIQGSAADMMKGAMLDLWRAGFTPLVTIHDELGFSFATRERAVEAARIMRETMPISVPLRVDVDRGPSWGAARPMPLDEIEELVEAA